MEGRLSIRRDGCRLGGNWYTGVHAAGVDPVATVREQLDRADFDDSVELNVLARRLQIKDDEWTLQADVFQHGHTSGWLISELPPNSLSHDSVSS